MGDLESYLEQCAGASAGVVISREQFELENFFKDWLNVFGVSGGAYRNVLVNNFCGQNLGNFSFIGTEPSVRAIRLASHKTYSKKPVQYQTTSITAVSYLARLFSVDVNLTILSYNPIKTGYRLFRRDWAVMPKNVIVDNEIKRIDLTRVKEGFIFESESETGRVLDGEKLNGTCS